MLKPVNPGNEIPMSTSFAFDFLAGEVLRDHFDRDSKQAVCLHGCDAAGPKVYPIT
jgi:hypothetical protein